METDTKVLLTTVAGSNYRTTEGSSDVVLKEDSEYPDWLWSLDVTRPVPAAKDLPKGTMEYFVRLHEEEKLRQNRMAKGKRFRRPWYNPAEKIMEIH